MSCSQLHGTKTVQEEEKTMNSETVGADERELLDNIPRNPNTIRGSDLAYACGMTSSAMVRRKVNALRSAGFPIVSTRDGCSIATDAKQIEDCILSLRSRVAAIEGAIAGLYRSFGAVAQ